MSAKLRQSSEYFVKIINLLFLFYAVEAEIFSTALLAMSTFPDGIKVAHGCVDKTWFIG